LSDILKQVDGLIRPLIESEHFELVDLTYQKGPNGWVLCFYIDKPGGISLDDCSLWSHQIGSELEKVPVISNDFSLEVSSPGVYRPLKKDADFIRFKGERVSIRLFAPINGQKNFRGILSDLKDECVFLVLENQKEISFPLKSIAKANLDPEIKI
jgi:ribosome maturation factor RimP